MNLQMTGSKFDRFTVAQLQGGLVVANWSFSGPFTFVLGHSPA